MKVFQDCVLDSFYVPKDNSDATLCVPTLLPEELQFCSSRDCFSFDKCTAAAFAGAASKEKFNSTYSFGLIFFRFCQLDSVLEVALSGDLFQGGPLH